MAMGVLKVARRLGIRVPDQLSLVGFDNIRFAEHVDRR
jgi:LacI family repressor for deo operon, udp, cdd, tsx, nupC, and nupG